MAKSHWTAPFNMRAKKDSTDTSPSKTSLSASDRIESEHQGCRPGAKIAIWNSRLWQQRSFGVGSILRLRITLIALGLACWSMTLDATAGSLPDGWPPEAVYRGA